MHFHYYSLKALAKTLNELHQGERIISCFTQNKDELVIELESGVLRVGCHTPLTYLVPFPEFGRARRNVADLFPEVIKLRILAFQAVPFERIMRVELENGYEFVLKLHGPGSNSLLYRDGKVIKLFKQQQEQDFDFVAEEGYWKESGLAANPPADETSVLYALRTISPIFERKFSRAVVDQMQDGISFSDAVSSLSQQAQDGIWYLLKEKNRIRFYPFRPPGGEWIAVKGIVAALQLFLRTYYQYENYRQMYAATEKAISKPYQKLQRSYESYLKNIHVLETDRSPEEIGHLIMANLHAIPANSKSVALDDFYTGEKIEIKLDARLNPQDNAKRYYTRHKQRKGKLKYLRELLDEMEEKLLEGETKQEQFQQIVPPTALELSEKGFDYADLNALRKLYKVLHRSGETVGQKRYPYRSFQFQGYEIFVGKGAANNDQLSFKFANKEDLWLHAKDVTGSHVIIRKRPGQPIPPTVLEYAAQLAAYYSKRKNDTLVPVQFTPRKYIRKRKGDPPGLVAVDREEVIMVEPIKKP